MTVLLKKSSRLKEKKNNLFKLNKSMREKSFGSVLLYLSVSFPVFFALFVFLTGNVNYPQATIESYKYIEIAKYWIDQNSTSWVYGGVVQRLPLYPVFIYLIFEIFGFNNLVALIFFQAILGSLTIYMTIKILELLNLSKNLLVIFSIFFNFHIFYRFSVFLPNAFFLFFLTTFIFCFTKFFFDEKKKTYLLLLSISIIALLLVRPVFQLSIFLIIPFLIFLIFKKTFFKKKIKFLFSIFLVVSYFLGLFVQMIRNYNEFDRFSYTIQTGGHLLYVVTALNISEKSSCGDMDPEMMVRMQKELENRKFKLFTEKENDLVSLNRIKITIAKEFLFNEIKFNEAFQSIFCAYFKTFFHPSPSAIYQAFGLSLDGFSVTDGENFIEKSQNFLFNSLKNTKNFFWLTCFFFLCCMRFLQIYGIVHGLFFSENRLYFWFLFIVFLTVIAPIVGMSSLRFRTEVESILIIFGALGIDNIINKIKLKYNKSSL